MTRKAVIYPWEWGVGYTLRVYVKASRSAAYEYLGFVKFFRHIADAETFAEKYADEIEYHGEVI